jgi:AcrR family transcriptional regulator
MDRSILSPRRKPKQDRARELVAAVEQACVKVLEEEGPQHLTTNRIAEVAGVNISSLYRYFPNKEAVLAAVYAAKLATEAEALVLKGRVVDEIANRSLEDSLRLVIHMDVETHRSLSRLNEHFYGRYHHTFELLTAATLRAATHGLPPFAAWFSSVLERHREDVRVTDFALASFLVTRTIEGVIGFAVEERPDLLDNPSFEEELLALALRYVEAGPTFCPRCGAAAEGLKQG